MKRANKLLALLAALCLITALVAGCSGTSSSTATSGSDASGGAADGALNLSVCLASEPETIDHSMNSSVDGAIMAHHFFEGLVRWADDGSDNLEAGHGNAMMVPGQAESWEKVENEDGTVTYTFTLRDGIKWSDGQPVTAADFEYSMKRFVNPATGTIYGYILNGVVMGANEIQAPDEGSDPEEPTYENAADPDTLAVTAIDDKTLEIVLVNDCPYFLELMAFPALFPVRQDIIEANGDQWTFNADTYVSNGPYKLQVWEHNSYIEAVKNEEYYDYDQLGPDSIRFVLMDDDNAMLAGFRSGELDFIENMPTDEIPALTESGELHVVDYIGTYYVSFNIQVEPFTDARVREALTLVIDRNNIVDNIARTGEVPAGAFVPPGIYDAEGSAGETFRQTGGDYYSVDAADYEANCERARELLAEAGYPDGEGFPAVEYLYNTNDRHRQIAEAMQADWLRELGINITLNNQDWSVVLQNRRDGNYQITRDGWISDYNDPISFLDMYLSGSSNNNAQLRSADYDELIADSRKAIDAEMRMALLHSAENFLMEDYIVAPVYYYTQKYMLNPEIEGLYYTPLGYFLFDRCHI